MCVCLGVRHMHSKQEKSRDDYTCKKVFLCLYIGVFQDKKGSQFIYLRNTNKKV